MAQDPKPNKGDTDPKASDKPPAEPATKGEPTPSTNKAGPGRILMVHDRGFKAGPYPGITVSAQDEDGSVAVNVFVNGNADPFAMNRHRKNAAGNTLTQVPVYDALTEAQRTSLRNTSLIRWAEWPARG